MLFKSKMGSGISINLAIATNKELIKDLMLHLVELMGQLEEYL
jgi:hypothetical protein